MIYCFEQKKTRIAETETNTVRGSERDFRLLPHLKMASAIHNRCENFKLMNGIT